MTYTEVRPLTDHLNDVIDIWIDHYQNNITKEGVEALKDTIRLTPTSYYGG